MAPTSSEWLVFSQWLRRSSEPSGSTRTLSILSVRSSSASARTSAASSSPVRRRLLRLFVDSSLDDSAPWIAALGANGRDHLENGSLREIGGNGAEQALALGGPVRQVDRRAFGTWHLQM